MNPYTDPLLSVSSYLLISHCHMVITSVSNTLSVIHSTVQTPIFHGPKEIGFVKLEELHIAQIYWGISRVSPTVCS